MPFEDLNHGGRQAASEDLNSKLFACAYHTEPVAAPADKAPAAAEKQPTESQRQQEGAKDSTETREQRIDNKIKDRFGSDVMGHLKDWDWLIENRKKLEDGFKKTHGDDAWDMAKRMRELSVVDGKPLIYLSKQDGPTHGTLVPKRYDVYLRRGRFRSDDNIGHVNH